MHYTRIDCNTWSRWEAVPVLYRQNENGHEHDGGCGRDKIEGLRKEKCDRLLSADAVDRVKGDQFPRGIQIRLDAEGNLIRWDFVSPSYTDFHPEDESFTKMVTEYAEDLFTFCDRVKADRERHKNDRGISEEQKPNFFDVSCLPWVKYKHFDIRVFDEGRFLAPVVTWGRYERENGRLMMPLTMNIHHAVADGFHLSRFFHEVQEEIDTFSTV